MAKLASKEHNEQTDLRRPEEGAENSPMLPRDPIEPDPMNPAPVSSDTEPKSQATPSPTQRDSQNRSHSSTGAAIS